jgi:WD40 repeat protein
MSVGFSPDGKRVVSGSYDGTICIWNAETGEEVAGPFEGHADCVTSVGFSPDGRRVVSGSRDKTIHIWNAETGEEVAGPFEGHADCVTSVGFSPDGTRVVSGSYDSTIRIWNAETGEEVAGPFEGHTSDITSVGFSPDGRRVVSGSYDRTIRIWNAETGEEAAGLFEGHRDWVTSVGFSPDGKRIVSGSLDETIWNWNSETGEEVAGPFEGQIESLGFPGVRSAQTSDESLQRMAKFHWCHLHSDGWMKGEGGKGLLFWVPPSHRGHVCGTDTHAIIGASMTKLDLSAFAHSYQWSQCHRPTRTEPTFCVKNLPGSETNHIVLLVCFPWFVSDPLTYPSLLTRRRIMPTRKH